MSLANLIVQPTRAVLQADAAACFNDGRLAYIYPKLRCFETARAAITFTGTAGHDAINLALYDRGYRLDTLAELVTVMPTVLREAASMIEAEQECAPGAPMAVCMAGWWEERRQPAGWIMTNDTAFFDHRVAAYTWHRVDNSISDPTPAAELLGRPVEGFDISDPACFDIERDSLGLIEAMRRRPMGGGWPHPDPAIVRAIRIGGYIDQAEVTAAGVRQTRLVRWPGDRLGERIAA